MSEWWLLAEALWPPLKQAITISLGIVLALKALTYACLWCLRDPKREGPKPGEKGGEEVKEEEEEEKQKLQAPKKHD